MTRRWVAWLLLTAGLAAWGVASGAVADEVRVAAASDLKFALDEVAAQFTRDTGLRVQPVYGSSGQLTRQIEQGAPFELFLSADEEFVLRLADRGLTRDRGLLYAEGRLALFVPRGSPVAVAADLSGVRGALAAGTLTRFAIANPEHAPYGRAAEQALRHAGLWRALQGRLVLGENVSQAAQFAASGNASGGLIAHSLALAPTFRDRGEWVLIDAGWHRPLRQRMVLLRGASATASRFYEYLQGPAALRVLGRYGFTLPPQP
ncbi:MAG: molybdate ABC transporter substrate-binding protein [Steroidobacteraceae bacterium]